MFFKKKTQYFTLLFFYKKKKPALAGIQARHRQCTDRTYTAPFNSEPVDLTVMDLKFP